MIRYFHLGSKNRGQLRFLKRWLRPIQQYNRASGGQSQIASLTLVSSLGGSIKDDESIAAANENGIAMAFTSTCHLKH